MESFKKKQDIQNLLLLIVVNLPDYPWKENERLEFVIHVHYGSWDVIYIQRRPNKKPVEWR